jgi:hypothetical protein
MPTISKNIDAMYLHTYVFELLLQTFWAKKPCKKSADLHPRQGNLLQRNILQAQQNLSLLLKIGWRTTEKNLPVFFNMSVLDLDFYAFNRIKCKYFNCRFIPLRF